VLLTMTSQDVIHSLYVPDFRIKRDVVPGRYSKLWFTATEPGDHYLFCAEYCGTGHSDMITRVVVHPPGEFEKWLENAANVYKTMPPAQAGSEMYKKFGCVQCHTIDGKANTGPTFKGVFGSRVTMSDGSTVSVDENYVRESIMDPQAKIVRGFQGVMPTFKGKITDEQITWIIAYLKTLSDEH
jgi:cytochrome c oxidase subunit 2